MRGFRVGRTWGCAGVESFGGEGAELLVGRERLGKGRGEHFGGEAGLKGSIEDDAGEGGEAGGAGGEEASAAVEDGVVGGDWVSW